LDHHCPWLGTCIGKRNYKYFISFIWSVAILVINAIVFTSLHIKNIEYYDKPSIDETNLEMISYKYSSKQIISIVILSIVSFLGCFVFWLLGYHQYIVVLNETTNENLKKSYKKLGNPFDRGYLDNLKRLFRRDKRNWHPEE
jgi:palmitoyltransferase ZDHHC9/14/18